MMVGDDDDWKTMSAECQHNVRSFAIEAVDTALA